MDDINWKHLEQFFLYLVIAIFLTQTFCFADAGNVLTTSPQETISPGFDRLKSFLFSVLPDLNYFVAWPSAG